MGRGKERKRAAQKFEDDKKWAMQALQNSR